MIQHTHNFHLQNYGIYKELVENGYLDIYTKDLDESNIDIHFTWIINILNDGIETDTVRNAKIRIHYVNKKQVTMHIIDYMFNLMMWSIIVSSGEKISSQYQWNTMFDPITKKSIKSYIDKNFIRKNIGKIDTIKMNQSIDNGIGKFRDLENFQMYLANTVNLEDTIELMNKYPEFNDTIHFDVTGIPLEDVKDAGMKATNLQIQYIKNSNHCLKDSFLAGEGINAKQYKEVSVNIGTKPNGQGGVFPHPIQGSFINGGLKNPEEIIVESSIGRIAQILQKQNVGQSGAFARNLGLNNQDSKLHSDPNYVCDTKHFEEIVVENQDMLDEFDMRYYRTNPNGVDKRIDATKDKDLIGQLIYLRSPMKCASAARGEGICYKCYGDLAHINRDINIGQIAAELLSSIYTQILLSAKHLLESAIIKMHWTAGFSDLFNVEYNQISLKEEVNYKGFKMIIEDDFEDEADEDDIESDMELSSYILYFDIVYPNGERVTIKSADSDNEADNIYLHQDLIEYMNNVGLNDDGVYELDLNKMKKLQLFVIDVKNNELSRTMKAIKNIIDNKKSTKSYNSNNILADFIKTNLSGNIKIDSVHFEVLLMNQMRSGSDILELPDWTANQEDYQILTLSESLANNRSISVRLQYSKTGRTLIHSSNRRLKATSNMDVFYMEQPQKFITDEYQRSTYEMKDDIERRIVKPFTFVNRMDENAGGDPDLSGTEEE